MKKQLLVSILCAAVAAVLLIWGFSPAAPPPSGGGERYVLLIEDDTGTFLMQLQKGMREAADERGAELAVINAAEYRPADEDAVFLLLSSPAEWLKGYAGSAVVTVIGSRVPGRRCMRADDEDAAVRLMERALELGGDVCIVTDETDARGALRCKAALAVPGADGVKTVAVGQPLPDGTTVAVGISSRATQALAQLKREGAYIGQVLGVDTGDNRAADLEDGSVLVMALDNPYAMGYVSVSQLHGSAEVAVPVLLAEISNMYLSQNVKQVFPLLQ